MNTEFHNLDSSAASGALDFFWLELTNQCNLKCVHCYSESSPQSTDTDVLDENAYSRLLADAYDLGCRRVQFIGGEPTLNRNLQSLISRASALGFELIEVYTNLVRLSDALLAAYVRYGVAVATSVYAHTSELHDLVTQIPGSHKRTLSNIERLLREGVRVRVSVIGMDENSAAIESTFSALRKLGVTNIGFDRVREFGRGQKEKNCSMDNLCGNCANNILAIGPNGIVAPCIMSKAWSVGSVLHAPLTEIARSELLIETRHRIANATIKNRSALKDDIGLPTTSCSPWGSPNPCSPDNTCGPNCTPSYNCTPCSPNAGQPCQPNRWCNPSTR